MEIYLIANTLNGKQYIGQTSLTLKDRIDFYYLHLAYPTKGFYPIERAMQKYGIDSFTFETLRECFSQEELDFWEKHYIKKLGSKIPKGYNVQDGGRRAPVAYKYTTRERLVLKRYRKVQLKSEQRERWHKKWLARDPEVLKPLEEQTMYIGAL